MARHMAELGDFAPAMHAHLMEPLAEGQDDFAVLVGDEMLSLSRELGKAGANPLHKPAAFAHCSNPAEAISALEEYGITAGDAILVKGSNSVGLNRLVAHFIDRNATGREG